MSGPTAEKAKLGAPDRWMFCPKLGNIVDDLFVPFKTPLCGLYDGQIEERLRFHPEHVFSSPQLIGRKVGLWLDLTKTDRFYFKHEIERHGCRYRKIKMAGHGSSPSTSEISEFIREVDSFIKSNPGKLVAVHCTHGFNRTGFAIVSYLVTEKDYSVDFAVHLFARCRPSGIYKQDYLNDLFERFNVPEDCVEAPPRPSWEFGEGDAQDELSNCSSHKMQASGSKKRFMDGLVPGVEVVQDRSMKLTLQAKIKEICGAKRDGFPGLQPVSMVKPSLKTAGNIQLLKESHYLVSWKADGMRYMVLINEENEVYAFDRDNEVFHIKNLDFPHSKEPRHVKQTLVDAEMVIDEDKATGAKYPRLLIYDIVSYEGQPVGQMDYNTRRKCIEKELIGPRNAARSNGKMREQAFSVRRKEFWELSYLPKLLDVKFKENLGHDMDGLIFQPISLPYTPGRCDAVLKWKDPLNNSVDFHLKIKKEMGYGEVPKFWGFLYVQHSVEPLAKIKALRSLQKFDDKIVECNYDIKTNEWRVMRERTDKSLPNSFNTAMSVWESIQNPITEQELIQYVLGQCVRKRDAPSLPPASEAKKKKQES